ncbi:hypothetical protein HRbin28_01149 [bacterium HR28]|nr:hypothetical protein HRbin28_01149 [bacterium HR28]
MTQVRVTSSHIPEQISPEHMVIPGWDQSRLGPLRVRSLTLPRTGRNLTIVQPADTDRLLELAQDDPEEQLPYWAELWPSGIALGDAILLNPDAVCGRFVVELGCGLGVTAVAALWAGAELLVTDYSPEALLLTHWNCLQNTGRAPATWRLNWRQPSPEFLALVESTSLPLVLAADVLYEERDIVPLLALVERMITPGGSLWLAEPGRRTAAMFVERLRTMGWQDDVEYWPGPWPDASDTTVTVAVHRLRRP